MAKKRGEVLPRVLDNWIDSFMEWSSALPSPEIYRRWAGFSIVAGALERRCWSELSGGPLYPGMFILLVGEPAVGKTQAIRKTSYFWAACGELNVAPESLTKAALVDELDDAYRDFDYLGHQYIISPVVISAEEFGVLLPEYDKRFLHTLCDLYDCLDTYKERVRHRGKETVIDRPYIYILAGTTPSYLGEVLPEAAYSQGFTSRMMMIFSGSENTKPLFGKLLQQEELEAKLIKDLISIANLAGEFTWTEDAQKFVEHWNKTRKEDAPTHPKLIHYVGRRVLHGIKLAMTLSAARTNDLCLTLEDIETAKSYVVQAELLMPEIFKSMTTSSDASELEEVHRFLFYYCDKYGVESVPEHKLRHFMAKKIPVNRINDFLESMLKSRLVVEDGANVQGHKKYKPIPLSIYD